MEVNWKDRKAVKEFFDIYGDLPNSELAALVGVYAGTINRWRHRLGLVKTKQSSFMKPYKMESPTAGQKIPPGTDWKNKEWLTQKYVNEGIGVVSLAKMIGINHGSLYDIIYRMGIPLRKLKDVAKSKNPCCTKEWLMHHYADRNEYLKWCSETNKKPRTDGGQGLKIADCAIIAACSSYTIYNWLIKFQMYIRTQKEASFCARSNKQKSGLDRSKKADKHYRQINRPSDSSI